MAEVRNAEDLLGKLPFLKAEGLTRHPAREVPPAERIVRHRRHDVDVPAGSGKLLDHGAPAALGRALLRPVGMRQQGDAQALGLRLLGSSVNEFRAHV